MATRTYTGPSRPATDPAMTAPPAPVLPTMWQCTAVLHQFSPPPILDPNANVPFYQLCVATIGYIQNIVMSIQITGMDGRTWWDKIWNNDVTQVSFDRGRNWQWIDIGGHCRRRHG